VNEVTLTVHRGDLPAALDGMSSRLSLLVDLATMLSREVELDALLDVACQRLAEALHADRATIWLVDAERGDLFTRVAILPEIPELRVRMGRGIAGFVAEKGDVVRVDDASTDSRFDPSADRVTGYTTRSLLVAPIRDRAGGPVRGVLQALNRREGPFDVEDEKYIEALANQLGRALALTTLRPADPLDPGVTPRGPFNRIVGRSEPLNAVYERINRAAQTDATVLLRGETGTGKGLFARAIHVNSARQTAPFVTVDCTTLPAQLVESELFGHERGAFTGADKRVPGKVEMAQGGTLFLDEIGDLPADVQGKLLRFLQERVFERVGGRTTLNADVRVVCATHRDLETAVAEGRFRQDLYYRVRVVEIELPPLRERGDDEVIALARHFVDMYAHRYGRPGMRLGDDAAGVLRAHDFPGNVRELEHWMESAVVLSKDGVVGAEDLPKRRGPVRGSSPPAGAADAGGAAGAENGAGAVALEHDLALDDAVRRYVEVIVARAGGNKAEAARRLKIGRNTLSRILKGGGLE
jgi:Nif-specific regulatory protein